MMSSMKWILAPAIAVLLAGTMDTKPAKADFGVFAGPGISISVGGGYPRYGSYYGFAPSYRSIYGHALVSPYRSCYPPGHYRYHPAEAFRHRNHYHFVPGHYDYYPGRGRHRGHHGHH